MISMISLVIRVKDIKERNGHKQKEVSDLLKIAPYVLSKWHAPTTYRSGGFSLKDSTESSINELTGNVLTF